MSTPNAPPNLLGDYLKDRRARLDPAALGFSGTRRRTPGLRREEVALRANVSATWYTWLEQGRGGAPSAEVLERLASALLLTPVEREHLFLLAQGRPPAVRYEASGVTPRLQRVLDAFELSPALVKTPTWDIVAWNRAAASVLTDYASLAVQQRNVLRLFFGNPRMHEVQLDWESVARFLLATFRAGVCRAGATAAANVEALVAELSASSPEFAALWREKDVRMHGEGSKQLRHPVAGLLSLEFSSFAVDGRPDLTMMVYNPTTADDAERIRALIAARVTAPVTA
ncbi:helix-turn-helix transcriptional regulator [Paraburkholderia kururiensis]|uniref:Helix-turn-helix transcriptional regulator n=1 Tax=Paraburkholderia kururiensis TaxID=984307 RepID=A0ABZ0WRE6_9BURK|nr:helix-turn-helix transcriptional regulator [Paraburkholderia kururiensis]WQD79980.1 helix-turn-helix transcriptional regulator [Paraburkholderia kururiensis]